MIYLYNLIIYKPLLNVLVFFYNTIAFHDLGIAIILLTLLIRIILYPIFQKSARYQKISQNIQPKIAALKEKHKDDTKKQSEEMMALYKEHGINPFSGFAFLLIQIPLLIALYHISLRIFTPEAFQNLYGFIHAPEVLNNLFLGLINLQIPNMLIIILAAAAQYVQARMSLPKSVPGQEPTQAEKIGKMMALFSPILYVVILLKLPSAVGLYWLTMSVLGIVQQLIINRQLGNGELGRIQ